jgi:HAD superfamily hydrolase (TIGR01509 family)
VAIRGLVFDFDGLLVDTEIAALQAWEELFAAYGLTLPRARWHQLIGTHGSQNAMLDLLAGVDGYDRQAIADRWWHRHLVLVDEQPLRPGVLAALDAAADMGLRLAIASSSTGDWVRPLLRHLGIADRFPVLSTADGGRPPKPAPDVYLAALDALDLTAGEAVAFEDSPHGVAAAKAAGLRCVAVPNAVTVALTFPDADLVLESLADLPLPDLLDAVGRAPAARH